MSNPTIQQDKPPLARPYMRLGHRGVCGVAPENTLASFDAAMAAGMEGFEFDIQLSKDGQPVIIHDDTLERTTNGSGLVSDYTLAQLQELSAGEHQGQTQRIMTFEELLNHVNGRCKLFIEIKNGDATHIVTEQIMQAVMHGNWTYEQLYFMSFDHLQILKARELCGPLRTCAILVGIPVTLAKIAQEAGAWSINPGIYHLSPELAEDARARNLKLLTWTINDARYLQRAIELGVDGIFSDLPDFL